MWDEIYKKPCIFSIFAQLWLNFNVSDMYDTFSIFWYISRYFHCDQLNNNNFVIFIVYSLMLKMPKVSKKSNVNAENVEPAAGDGDGGDKDKEDKDADSACRRIDNLSVCFLFLRLFFDCFHVFMDLYYCLSSL